MGSAALFARQFDKSAKRVKERLEEYMGEPENDEKVHDVRTALRRLEATFMLMPKKLRRRNRKQIDAHKQFFRSNSRVRDYDIIRGRIAARAQGDLFVQLAADLDRKRKSEVAGAVRMARRVSAMPAASLKGLKDGDLESRMDEVAGRLLGKVKKELPVVTADRKNVEELHRLRKDLKKLRYVLEAMPARQRKPHEKKASKILNGKKPAEERFKELQDMLGQIHDIDITVQYLSSLGKKEAIPVMQGEKAERDRLFDKFAKSVRS
ncbi:MAG: CHAD domain-containing protein [Nitrososphaera sp.]|uniref:CHAD domain-containing protein n=1 Tax=Nitrososphaera sp. TaxID=1971748 RepID=UPI001803156F|nr:CHAD domain-containing protein [Nitrososphaera sp.]NWG36533.1 CHAD domain-containing protein [Nitrososphaera sp.]